MSKQHLWLRPRPSFSSRSFFAPAVVALSLTAAAASAQTYTVVDVATIDEASTVVVRGVKAGETAVGGGRLTGARRALLFGRGGVSDFEGLPGTDNTIAFGINDQDDVVGGANADNGTRAFLRTRTGASRELAPLAGDSASAAFGVNNRGQAAGFSSGPDGERAVVWSGDGSAAALAGTGGRPSRARAINEPGDVVGVVGDGSAARAVLWPGGGAARELGVLGGRASSEAIDINARGDIVGHSATDAGARRATLWAASGAPQDLGTLAGGTDSEALAINNAGTIVGTCTSSAGARACLWRIGSPPQDLNALIPRASFVLTHATGINDRGVIVAYGHDREPHTHSPGSGDHGHDDTHELPVRIFLLVPAGGGR